MYENNSRGKIMLLAKLPVFNMKIYGVFMAINAIKCLSGANRRNLPPLQLKHRNLPPNAEQTHPATTLQTPRHRRGNIRWPRRHASHHPPTTRPGQAQLFSLFLIINKNFPYFPFSLMPYILILFHENIEIYSRHLLPAVNRRFGE